MQRRPLDIGVEMHDLHQSVDAGRCGRRRVIVMRCPAGSLAVVETGQRRSGSRARPVRCTKRRAPVARVSCSWGARTCRRIRRLVCA